MRGRALALPMIALAAVIGLLGVQLAFGGASFKPTPAANPCVEGPLGAASNDLDQVTQTIVLGGVQHAACTLGVTREALLLALPSAADREALLKQTGHSDAELAASLKTGMTNEVARLDRAGQLPPASKLVDTYASALGLSGFALSAIKAVPASTIDSLLPTGAVLGRAIGGLDVNALLQNLSDPAALEPELRSAIQNAALAEAKARLSAELPSSLKNILGIG